MGKAARKILFLAFMLVTLSVTAGPQDDSTPLLLDVNAVSPAKSAPPEVWDSLLAMTAAMGVVLVMIGAVAWCVKRYMPVQKIGALQKSSIEIVSRKSIGARQSLLLVKAGGRTLLIGRSPSTLNLISALDEPDFELGSESFSSGPQPVTPQFQKQNHDAFSLELDDAILKQSERAG